MSQTKYKLIIFDFDGTLADSFPWFLSIFEDLAAHFHLPALPRAELEKLRGMEIQKLIKEFNIPLWKIVQIGNHLQKMMMQQIHQITLIEGMQSVLDTLVGEGVRLAVVSSNAEENIRKVLGSHNAAYFEHFECGVSMFGKKSKFLKILKKTGVSAGHTLCIGDEVRDIQSAKQAHIPFGAVGWGYTHLQILQTHAPEEVFHSPQQILQALNSSNF